MALAPPTDWPVIAVMVLMGLGCWRVAVVADRRLRRHERPNERSAR